VDVLPAADDPDLSPYLAALLLVDLFGLLKPWQFVGAALLSSGFSLEPPLTLWYISMIGVFSLLAPMLLLAHSWARPPAMDIQPPGDGCRDHRPQRDAGQASGEWGASPVPLLPVLLGRPSALPGTGGTEGERPHRRPHGPGLGDGAPVLLPSQGQDRLKPRCHPPGGVRPVAGFSGL
jgi:hypothetical protein